MKDEPDRVIGSSFILHPSSFSSLPPLPTKSSEPAQLRCTSSSLQPIKNAASPNGRTPWATGSTGVARGERADVWTAASALCRAGRLIQRGKTMRWKKKLGALALLLASVTGCKQTYFITESERDHYRS